MPILKERLSSLANAADQIRSTYLTTLTQILHTLQSISLDAPPDIKARIDNELMFHFTDPDYPIYQSSKIIDLELQHYKLTHKKSEYNRQAAERRRRLAGVPETNMQTVARNRQLREQAKQSQFQQLQDNLQWANQLSERESNIQYYMTSMPCSREQAIEYVNADLAQQSAPQQPAPQQPDQAPHFIEGSRFIEDDPQFTIPEADPQEEEAPPD